MTIAAPTEWPEPQTLAHAAPPPPFPVDALPDWLADYVRAEAEVTQTPLDLAGMLSIAVISTAIQGRLNVHAIGAWVEPITAYVAVAMDPAERKSSVFAHMTLPLRAFEEVINHTLADEIARDAIVQRTLEHAAETAKKAADKAKTTVEASRAAGGGHDTVIAHQGDLDNALDTATKAQREFESFVPRTQVRLLLDDVTPEAAATRLTEQREFTSIMSPEGGIFEILGGRYSNSVNLDLFLKGHSGDMMRVDRQGRASQTLNRPIISMGMAVQPGVLTDLGKKDVMRNRGLIARFLYAVPPPAVGSRKVTAGQIGTQTAQAYADNIDAICTDAFNYGEPTTIPMTTEAQSLLAELDTALEPRLGPDGDLSEMSDIAGKHIGALVRLAAIIATARCRKIPDEIQLGDMLRAAEFGPYLLAHARRALNLMSEIRGDDLLIRVARKIRREGWDSFRSRDLQRAMSSKRAGISPEDLEQALEELHEIGWVKPTVLGTAPRIIRYDVNPGIYR